MMIKRTCRLLCFVGLLFLLFYLCISTTVMLGGQSDRVLRQSQSLDEGIVRLNCSAVRGAKDGCCDGEGQRDQDLGLVQGRRDPAITPEDPLFVLILSSLPRSGSTMLSEALSTLPGSVLFFEPLWIQEKTTCIDNEGCVADFLMDAFKCTYAEWFEAWLRSKHLFFNFFHPDVRKCTRKGKRKDEECFSQIDVRALCRDAPVRLTKVIRSKLTFLENYVRDADNFKVIYLTRDPRGSLNSIAKFNTWNQDPHERCQSLEDDLFAYDLFSEIYPSKVLHVKYEDFCLHPENKTSEIMSFLTGNHTIPQELRDYLAEHMSKRRGIRNMSTFKDSATEFQAWRNKITEDLLKKVESEPACASAVLKMGHRLFRSTRVARDLNISLFL
ncbi:uncharacterized protein LOC125029779 [Penaeus chinensis]|uniref:uncharacterized protein LOC125029779 n=1 Tax=Penaeus chinensis TaxID=139456 RepID=UPI001FB61B83|nr:uncharacterized protein LOC125029779 [Penaeus chinensis]